MAQPAKLTAQQRALLFAQGTRRNFQMLGSKTTDSELSEVVFQLPKTRLLSKIWVEVEAVVTLKAAAAATIELNPYSPYDVLRRVSLDLNNGFSPFIVSGRAAYLYNTNRLNPDVLQPNTDPRAMNYVENSATAAGKDNRIKFVMELPVTLNDRDTTGLVLLQNNETNVELRIDVDKLEKAYKLKAGETATFKSLKITPMVETFTIPASPEAFPDISVLKLVNEKSDTFAGNGQNIVPLHVGTIYRKLVLYFQDSEGNPIEDADFSGNIELVFNQADIPYSLKPSLFAAQNHSELGHTLPKGVYVFDFSNQGLPNYGGSRDYVDTERITEFWVRFSTQKAGKLNVISETLSRLQ